MGRAGCRESSGQGSQVKNTLNIADAWRPDHEPLVHLESAELMPLTPTLDSPARDRDWAPLSKQVQEKYECGLDDTCAVSVPRPANEEEERRLVGQFLAGLEKLFTAANNWTFLQPLLL